MLRMQSKSKPSLDQESLKYLQELGYADSNAEDKESINKEDEEYLNNPDNLYDEAINLLSNTFSNYDLAARFIRMAIFLDPMHVKAIYCLSGLIRNEQITAEANDFSFLPAEEMPQTKDEQEAALLAYILTINPVHEFAQYARNALDDFAANKQVEAREENFELSDEQSSVQQDTVQDAGDKLSVANKTSFKLFDVNDVTAAQIIPDPSYSEILDCSQDVSLNAHKT